MDFLRPLSSVSFGFLSPRSENFPPSKDDPYPSTKRPKNRIPSSLKTWVVVTTLGTMVVLAVAIEIALHFSNKNGGFRTGEFSTETVQWLSSFLPTLAIGPLVWIWKRFDNDFKKIQPYVNMTQGPVKAEKSVLLDLQHGGLYQVTSKALKNGEYLILASSFVVVLNILLHPMAGSFFLVKPGITIGPTKNPVESIATVGLNPSYRDITSFVAAAGFAEAAAFHNLSDPPFIKDNWAVAQFKVPLDVTRNSTIQVNTTGVETNVTCSMPQTFTFTPPPSAETHNWTLFAKLGDGPGCTIRQTIDSTAAISQYGVEPVSGCLGDTDLAPFSPAFFWFYTVPQNGAGVPVAQAVFCAPKIGVFQVSAAVDGATGLLVGVNATLKVDPNDNNVTSGNFAGRAFNGISFDSGSDFNLTDMFVSARALAVQSGIPGTIFRFASDPNQGGGLDAVFGNTTGFLGITESIYTQYLSLVALSNYFVPNQSLLRAELTTWPERLWINARNAHSLVALLLLVAAAGTIIHVIHRRKRKGLYLASRPGSMAHYMSLLSHAQAMPTSPVHEEIHTDNDFLGPLDDDRSMGKKLQGVRFMLDERTGAVVTVLPSEPAKKKNRPSWKVASSSTAMTGAGPALELEDPRKSLLGQGYTLEEYSDPFEQRRRQSGAGLPV